MQARGLRSLFATRRIKQYKCLKIMRWQIQLKSVQAHTGSYKKSSERDTASCKSIVNTQTSFEPHKALKTLTGRSQQKNIQDIKKKQFWQNKLALSATRGRNSMRFPNRAGQVLPHLPHQNLNQQTMLSIHNSTSPSETKKAGFLVTHSPSPLV